MLSPPISTTTTNTLFADNCFLPQWQQQQISASCTQYSLHCRIGGCEIDEFAEFPHFLTDRLTSYQSVLFAAAHPPTIAAKRNSVSEVR
jgi:hypothetical protein